MKPTFHIAIMSLGLLVNGARAEINNVYLIINDNFKGEVAVNLGEDEQPCINAPLLREWGIRDAAMVMETTPEGCILPDVLNARKIGVFFEPIAQLLTVDIPASLLGDSKLAGRWDDGINAAFVNYQFNYGHYAGENYRTAQRHDSLYADVTAGANIGPWRLRYQPVYQKDTWGEPTWHTEKALAYRDIKAWRATLTVGDSVTPSALFDNVRFRGMSLVSDSRMLPDGLRQFSPWVRGFARSNAEVRVRQNGEVIYQTFVPPGAFVLKDVYPPAIEGDLTVTIRESDSTETERKIPYSSMPNLVYVGQWRYDATVGKYQPYYGMEEDQPSFAQASLSYGLPGKVTLYGGFQGADIYRSAAVGIGKSLNHWGAISADYTFSSARQPRRSAPDTGGMARMRYAKAFPAWESSLSLMAQYYPRQRYRTFGTAIDQQSTYWWDWEDGIFVGDFDEEKKYRLEARYNQYLSDSDSLYLTLVREATRGNQRGETSVEMGFSSSLGKVDVALYAEYNRPSYGKEQAQLGLSVSLPLSALGVPRMKLNYDHTLANDRTDSRRIGVSGTLLSDYSLSYNASTSQSQRYGNSQDVSGNYQYNAGEVRAGYSQGKGYRQQNMELSGSLMAHQEGITLGQTLGETIAIVSVPGTPGIGVDNQYGVTTDWRGYALISNLTPYRINNLTLDSFELPDTFELPESEQDVVPTAGAIMFSRFAPARKISPDVAQTSFRE
ncbi:fimbria/pilus outer membrane usher protein [Serratia fonticola]|uniref:fimbria/pilus outer membrane usher protein n=1 Tax=Serratia fonticola TaxID=47917 RepID=UPI0027F2DB25|nr:fimbria/pilus outer membrane usher protein [Serratia fonticola]MDQ7209930.1 fimbria/pilus outer membrane usher protein [Serratia fonticola]HBE9079299.1 fimbrial biogenesis outer membrane usher protein [Serratia fonticola]HBE9091575.1 fimbrial biogenesis outer membrane usher protein [Serratia fonticola]HBE9151072.1 fimbrial biogenesis outer membrane usher protein [Serratia fonticola]